MPLPQQEQASQEPFGYICRACSRCCSHKIIQVNPYEIARLARFYGISTSEFRKAYTDNGGAHLKRDEDDTCIFLGAVGCGVHPDRPLVCRLYPLGRRVRADGSETWIHMERPAECEGELSEAETIADYIAAQGALPYMQAADSYSDWVRRAHALAESGNGTQPDIDDDVLDMDGAIERWCTARDIPEPQDIEARRLLHLGILNHCLDGGKS